MVFGSFVADLMSRASHLPVPGETVKGSVFRLGAGGKGFNQAVAAIKAGGNVLFSTKLGEDSFAQLALDTLNTLGTDTQYVFTTGEHETGSALIMVDENTSQNQILVVAGACEHITAEDIDKLVPAIKDSAFLLTQLETSIEAEETVIRIAHENGVKVILNPAPVQAVNDEIYQMLYMITPNEVEASILSGVEITDDLSAERAAAFFMDKGVENVIVTLGSKGAYVKTADFSSIIPCYKVSVVDTTGAGDAFNGGLVTALSEGMGIIDAVKFANAVAALSVTKIGTSNTMPSRMEIDAFLAGIII